MSRFALILILIINFNCSFIFSQNQDDKVNDYLKDEKFIEAITLLSEGINVNIKGEDGKSPLHILAAHSNLDDYGLPRFIFEKILLEKGADVNAQDTTGHTPAMEIVLNSNNELALKLLFLYGADFTLQNNKGKTALDLAKENHKVLSVALIENFLTQSSFPRKTMITTYLSYDNVDPHHTNQAFFESDKEISRVLINGVKDGKIAAYFFDNSIEKNQEQTLTAHEFLERLELPQAAESDDFDEWADDDNSGSEPTIKEYYFPFQITLTSLQEEAIANKAGTITYQPKYVSLHLPAASNPAGFDKYICSFRFDDCSKLFEETPSAVWDNAFDKSFGNVLHMNSGSILYPLVIKKLFGDFKDINEVAVSVKEKNEGGFNIPDSIYLYKTEDNENYQLYKGVSFKEYQQQLENLQWIKPENSLKLKYHQAIKNRHFVPYYGEETSDSLAFKMYSSFLDKNKLDNTSITSKITFSKLITSDIPLMYEKNKGLNLEKKPVIKYLLKSIKKGKLIPYRNYKSVFNNDSLERISKSDFWENLITVADARDNYIPVKNKFNKAFSKYVSKRVLILGMIDELRFNNSGENVSHHPKYISLIIPARFYERGFNKTIAYFEYDEFLKALRKKAFKNFISNREFMDIVWDASPVYENSED